MPLARRVERAFRGVIRGRGDAYARGGRVALTEIDATSARALVQGSRGAPYAVEIRALPAAGGATAALAAECTCPHFDKGEACKHLWATLRALDEQGWEPSRLQRHARLTLELAEGDALGDDDLEDEDLDDENLEDEDVWIEVYGAPPEPGELETRLAGWHPPRASVPVPGARRARGTPRREASQDWRLRLGRLSTAHPPPAAAGGDERLSALAGSEAPLLYLVDPEEAQPGRALRVHLGRRGVRRDGSLGAIRPARLFASAPATAATPDEASALAQLVALAQAAEASLARAYGAYRTAYRGAYEDPGVLLPSSVEVPHALLDPLLPRLATTGRLALRSGGAASQAARPGAPPSPETRWLRSDPGAPWELRLELARAARGYELRGRLERGEETLSLEAPACALSTGFLVTGDRLARADLGDDTELFSELRVGPIRIPARELDEAVVRLAALPGLPPPQLAEGVPWRERVAAPVPRLRFAGLEGPGRALAARLDFGYGGAWVAAGAPQRRIADRAARTLSARDVDAEARALALLASLGFRAGRDARSPAGPPLSGDGAAPDGAALDLDAAHFEAVADELLAKGWIVEAEGARLRRAGRSWARVHSGVDFFDLEGGIDFEGESAPFPALLAAAQASQRQARVVRLVRLADGSRGLLPRTWLERCAGLAGLGEPQDERLRFTRPQVGLVDALLGAQDESRADRRFAALRRRLLDFRGIEPAREPAGFRGRLRDYQRTGTGWLRFLRRFGLGGCLADDMGLGKTVQVLALLADRSRGSGTRRGARRRASLVVAPRSVAHGWVEEAERFTPGLEVLRYTGGDRRALRGRVPACDLVVTTYGILRRDADWLASRRFDTVILDEAQAIKNRSSRTARAARSLQAEQRLALTGTPVENHVGELASLLDFLNPGLLGRARGLDALARGAADPASLDLVSRALRPLVLRRTKEQVLRELPPKTEQTLHVELAPGQRRLYEELRRHYQASLTRRIERQGMARSKIHVLEALLRLRQAACHPALLDRARAGERAGKLDVLFAQLEEVTLEGHKALVFSQFTRFLALVRAGLEERGIAYAYLDGRTRDRAARVTRFQEDPDCRVFAISLKAGGTGLNLTAAYYVFLLDPWWNPAVEAQAVDRTHRIGQIRPVMAYRLVAEGTVEEKIRELQDRKRALAQALLGDEKSLIGKLTAEDLRHLLG